jgi:hypothetical protein
MQADGVRLGMQATKDRMELESKQELEKMRIRADVAKSHTQLQQQMKAKQKPTKE